tara:strand:- start:301 stop:696 length:396 start_codon:yes stop_codon:yes gene_type:complete
MASELRVNTLKDASGNNSVATSVVFGGTAKAWVDIPANGASLNDSFNIGSSTDSGTGDRRVAFTNNMATANYAITTGVDDVGAGTSSLLTDISTGTQAATGFDAEVYYAHQTADRTNYDAESYYTVHGDLA